MSYIYFLFSHLVSDYIFQTRKLVKWKIRSYMGLFVHVLIHFIFTFLILFLYTGDLKVVFPVFGLAVCHFIIDSIKASYDRKGKKSILYYWLDQFAHYLSILIIIFATKSIPWLGSGTFERKISCSNSLNSIFLNPFLIIFFCMAIFVTLTIEYGGKDFNKNQKNPSINFKKMIKRLFLSTILYVGLLFALVPSMGSCF